jgi:hypothetical protein
MRHLALGTLAAGVAFVLWGVGPARAQTTPAPKASPTPHPFTYAGYIRSFGFTRLNNPQLTKANPLNQASLTTALDVHAAYAFLKSFSVGATYLYATPFYDRCNTSASHAAGMPCVNPNTQALNQGTNPDDTLPGFTLNTLYEAYLQYKDPKLGARLGYQVLNTPWANPSDSRIKPVAFLAGDAGYNFTSNWTGEVVYGNQFQARASSQFLQNTLLTATKIADAPGAEGNLHIPNYSSINTAGFWMGRAGYTHDTLLANAYYYGFLDIASAFWGDLRYTWANKAGKPFVALQGGAEVNGGNSVIGKINSQIFGVQGGYSPWNGVDLAVGYNYIPQKSDTLVLPAGVTCTASGSIGGTSPFQYFLPTGGTPQCHTNGNGTTTVYYGGWASPYTDSYATDVLFTTSISQGMIDRRSSGQAVKVSATFTLDNKRIRFIASRAYYDYGNALAGVAPTQETDLDGTYFFNAVAKGPYRGLSFRYRYAERTQNFFTTNPDFKYNRAQLEYAF